MKRTTQWLGTASAFALVAAPTIAEAAGTTAGTSISNQVSVSYSVGGNAQTAINSNTDTFTVDEKVDVTVATSDSSALTVSPGQSGAVRTFTVTNNSNATVDFLLTATDQSGGTARWTGNDTADIGAANLSIYVETNGTGGLQTATDKQASSLAAIAAGATVTVYVVANVPNTLTQGQQATVYLTAQAASGVTAISGTSAGTGGTALTQNTGANNKGGAADILFADAAGDTQTGDTQYNGKHAARADYVVDTAQLTITKVSRITADGVSTSNFKSIPGATVEYCIVVANTSSTVGATAVSIADKIDTTMLQSISLPTVATVNGTTITYNSGTSTCTGGSPSASWTSIDNGTTPATYNQSVGSVAAGATAFVRFTAVIK